MSLLNPISSRRRMKTGNLPNIKIMKSLDQLQTIFIEALEREVLRIGETAPTGLYEPVQYTLQMGGKRLRPVMLLYAANLFGNDYQQAVPAAIGLEVFHNFTLLHDDIMDKADIRRGNQTVHLKYDENTAILSGDAMSILAYRYLGQTDAELLPKILPLFTQTALEVCEGQQYDMEFETRTDVSVDEYIEMIRLKTAVLIACSLKMGALLGGASAKDADLLYDFGINIGLAFQLQDDWLDVFGVTSVFGKKIGGDIRSNKKTYLLLKALELANEKEYGALMKWVNAENPDLTHKVEAVTALYKQVGADDNARQLMQEYHSKAIISLDNLSVAEADKAPLYQFAEKMISRIS